MDVILYDEEEILRMRMDINDIEAFVNLVRDFGYTDKNGVEYLFLSASVEENEFCIYLQER
jgi:hypothetical protein